MVAKVFLKLSVNIAINIILFIIYAFLFGRQSIDKYIDNGVSIINQEEGPASDIIPPGRGICTSWSFHKLDKLLIQFIY